MKYDVFESPIGELTICTDGEFIRELHIEGDRYFSDIPSDWERDKDNELLRQARRQLAEYFAGTRSAFDLPLATRGTSFQESVWQAICSVPSGSTSTYAEIAAKIGRPSAARAVGTAVGRNPICVIIPCHRILASNGSMGGFVAGTDRKQRLLDQERI